MSTFSSHAQAQEPDVAILKAAAPEVVSSISDNEARTEARCQITDPNEQLDQPDQKKSSKKKMDLSRLQKKLGPKHVALIHALKDVDPESPHGRELALIIDSLDKTHGSQRAI
jgi:hypothetical protein